MDDICNGAKMAAEIDRSGDDLGVFVKMFEECRLSIANDSSKTAKEQQVQYQSVLQDVDKHDKKNVGADIFLTFTDDNRLTDWLVANPKNIQGMTELR